MDKPCKHLQTNRLRVLLFAGWTLLSFLGVGGLLSCTTPQFVQVRSAALQQSRDGRYAKCAAIGALAGRRRPNPPVFPTGLSTSKFDPAMFPVMKPAEAFTLQWYASQACTYVEFGTGASTILAAPLANTAMSIENHKPFCEEMQARTDVSFWMAQGKLQYECADTGETCKFLVLGTLPGLSWGWL
jgi:hypothetical protein